MPIGIPLQLVGQRFSRLLVEEKALSRGKKGSLMAYWRCRCDCGNVSEFQGDVLIRGVVHSCGCYKRERAKEVHTKHGMSGTPIYAAWHEMLERCKNPKHESYANYGGRGIKVCERWHKFTNFFLDMGNRPEGMWIERKNNDLGYSPDNCIWATPTQNLNNRRPRKRKSQ
jgi:hypothetical protein